MVNLENTLNTPSQPLKEFPPPIVNFKKKFKTQKMSMFRKPKKPMLRKVFAEDEEKMELDESSASKSRDKDYRDREKEKSRKYEREKSSRKEEKDKSSGGDKKPKALLSFADDFGKKNRIFINWVTESRLSIFQMMKAKKFSRLKNRRTAKRCPG